MARWKLIASLLVASLAAAQTQSYPPSGGSGSSGALTRISQQVLGSPAATVTFAAIPGTYTNLVLTFAGRSTASVNTDAIILQFNGDAATDYTYSYIAFGGTLTEGSGTSTSALLGHVSGASSLANGAGAGTVRILNYAGTTFLKTFAASAIAQSGATLSSSEDDIDVKGIWGSTSAITSIVLSPATGPNFVAGSTFTLYGEQ